MPQCHLLSRFHNTRFQNDVSSLTRISWSLNGWSIEDICPPFVEKDPGVVGASSTGLVCFEYEDGTYAFWNPFMNQYKILPEPIELPACDKYHDSTSSCIRSGEFSLVCGFGFDSVSGDHKFVKFTKVLYSNEDEDDYMSIHSGLLQISLYSLLTNSWKEITCSEEYNIEKGSSLSLGGSCYWKSDNNVVVFNLTTEKFSSFPFPIPISHGECGDLIDSDGSLAFVVYSCYGTTNFFRFWIMNVEAGWTRNERLDVCISGGARNPLGFAKNGSSLFLQGMDGELLEYDYIARQLKRISEFVDYPLYMDLFSYVETTIQLGEETYGEKKKRRKEGAERKSKSKKESGTEKEKKNVRGLRKEEM